ncbi:MAG: MarR family transcriptional regulator [Flavobacteriales bacterium]|nr:MarR family transcriptional regulator [Flavobacteriales bacterium]
MSQTDLEFPRPLVAFMGKTMKHIDMLMCGRLAESGIALTVKQVIVLHKLERGCTHQSELAILTGRDKGSLTRLIQSLERKGFVERTASTEDKRVNIVLLTPSGRQMLDRARPILDQTFEAVLDGISEDDRLVTRQVLQQILQNTLDILEPSDP